ncbi:MAG: sterol desaturase family protein [Chitinophagaceae bacterium]|nr:MAG: sterol desaturase family protein [Chitinophagaceae bacterium]
MEDPILYAIPVFIVFILLELGIAWKIKRDAYELKDSAANITMGLGSAIIGLGVKSVVLILFLGIYQYRIFDIGFQWWAWLILLFADDFSFYWHHRLSHQIRLLWAAHVNHHSSQKYNLSVALRQSWTEVIYKYIFWMWLPLIGFHPLMVMTMISINLIYQFFVHTEVVKKMGVLEYFMNTPSHHRVHHASNIRYLDKNHAGIFIIWDKLFGTFSPEDEDERPVYGITRNINTHNPLKIASHEFADLWKDVRKADNLKDKILYIIMPPGWSPDGSTLTSNQLRALDKKDSRV